MTATCGTESGYVRHLAHGEPTCPDCRRAHSLRVKHRLHNPIRIDPGPAAEHVADLVAAGMTVGEIANRAGVSHDTLTKLRKGHQQRMHRDTLARILAVRPASVPTALVDITGTLRRVQALLFLGWRHEDMQRECGVRTSVLVHARDGHVTRATADRIAAMYDRLSMTPGPSRQTATRAQRLGYLSPLAWDDDTIDDPGAWASPGEDTDDLPDDVVVDRLLRGEADWRDAAMADRREAARRAFAGAVEGPYTFCERRLGLNSEAIRSVVEAVAA